jgi:hypothetical protein
VDAYAVVRGIGDEGQSHVPIFRTTPQKMTGGDTTRPIAYDDSSKDFLDTRDLRRALGQAKAATGVRFDLIGMDACLMAMVEGARELVHFTDYFVASQEVEPMTGWPYRPILAGLDSRPDMPAADLANLIVEEFARSYGGATRGETVTQSAIALPRTGQTEALCKALAEAILADGSASLKRLVARAEDKALVFQDRNYRDLGDFAAKLAEETEWEDFPAVTAAAAALRDHLQARSAEAPVLRVGFLPDYQRATGLSVYLPPSQRAYVPEPYRRLLFAQATGWDRLLDWLFGE